MASNRVPSPIVARATVAKCDRALKKAAARVAACEVAAIKARTALAAATAAQEVAAAHWHAAIAGVASSEAAARAALVHWRMRGDVYNRCRNKGVYATENRLKLTCPECKALFSDAAHGVPVIRRGGA
jgi:hypothetical protein